MIFTIIVMFLSASVLLFKNIKNKYSWIFILLFLALNVILFSLLLQIVKLSNYRSIFTVENQIYFLLSKIKIGYYNVKSFINLGIALFLFGMCGFFKFKDIYIGKHRINKIYMIIFSIIPIVLYLFYNSFYFNEKLFLYENKIKSHIITKSIVFYNYSIIYIYIALPFLFLWNTYKTTKIVYKKIQTMVLEISLVLVDLFFCSFFIFGLFRNLTVNNMELYNFDMRRPEYNQYVYTYMPAIVMVFFDLICYLLIHYKLLEGVNLFKNKVILKRTNLLPQDIKHIFHSYKNAMFSIVALEEKAEEKYGAQSGLDSLKEIKNVATEFMKQAGEFINIFNEIVLDIDEINIVECLNNAVGKILKCYDVKIEISYECNEAYAFADKKQLTEMFYNLLINSVEAINKKEAIFGKIIISAFVEPEWICVSIYDNGCGMTKKQRKNMFKPLVSSKKSFNNWGLGLSYVYKVIKAHLGLIFVKSILNQYTELQIMLPNSKSVISE